MCDIEVKPRNFGRIAAQTAKQVITQRIREAERDSVFAEFAEREGELVNGTIRNVDARSGNVVVSLGKAEAILPRSEQIPREHYRFSQRIRVYIVSVERSVRGPQITVSRTHPDLLKRLLELEVPEIYNGTVEVKGIAREPGFRSKVAVAALQSGVDPVGSCVGMRGVRIQNIVNELVGEKIDVVEWAKDERVYIANALSPAKVVEVFLDASGKERQGRGPGSGAVAGDRQGGAERPPCGTPDGLADRHQERGRGRRRARADGARDGRGRGTFPRA